MNSEVQRPFMLDLLDTVLGTLHLPHLDIRHLSKCSLSEKQYLNFHVNFQELAAK